MNSRQHNYISLLWSGESYGTIGSHETRLKYWICHKLLLPVWPIPCPSLGFSFLIFFSQEETTRHVLISSACITFFKKLRKITFKLSNSEVLSEHDFLSFYSPIAHFPWAIKEAWYSTLLLNGLSNKGKFFLPCSPKL